MTKPTFGISNKDPTESHGTKPNFIAAKPATTQVQWKEVAAVWVKQTANGAEYLSMKIMHKGEIINLTVFKNKTKKSINAPDYVRVEKIEPQGEIV